MATTRKPKPVQHLNPDARPAWHASFMQYVELVASTAPDADAAHHTVLMTVGMMADLANVRDGAYDLFRDRATQYSRACVADRAMVRALNAAPGSWDCKPHALKAAVQDAHGSRDAARSMLWAALPNVRPSLALT